MRPGIETMPRRSRQSLSRPHCVMEVPPRRGSVLFGVLAATLLTACGAGLSDGQFSDESLEQKAGSISCASLDVRLTSSRTLTVQCGAGQVIQSVRLLHGGTCERPTGCSVPSQVLPPDLEQACIGQRECDINVASLPFACQTGSGRPRLPASGRGGAAGSARGGAAGASGSGGGSAFVNTVNALYECSGDTEGLPDELSVSVAVDGSTHEVALTRHSVRSPKFYIETYDVKRDPVLQEISPLPAPRTYRGTVVGDPYLVATGVVDESGVLYLSAWNGRHRAWIADVTLGGGTGLGSGMYVARDQQELRKSFPMPSVDDGRLQVPEPGADFHVRLARTAVTVQYEGLTERAGGSMINALAQVESNINELDHVFGQAIGLRFDLSYVKIEVGQRTNLKWGESTREEQNLVITLGKHGICQASKSGGWLLCKADYRLGNVVPHETGHILGLSHFDGMADTPHHIMSVSRSLSDTEVALMQSRIMLEQLQGDSKYYQARAFDTPMLPAAYVDYLTVYAGEHGSVWPLDNDYDANGDVLAIADHDRSSREGGRVSRSGDRLLYTPRSGFVGPDAFTYTASDGHLRTKQMVHVLVLPDGLAGAWEVGAGGDRIVDSGPLGQDLVVVDSDKSSALTGGVDGLGLKSLASVSADFQDNLLGDAVLPHIFDPGHESFTASVWFKYSAIGDDLMTILRDGDPQDKRVIVGKGTRGNETVDPYSRPNLDAGGWEIRAEGTDLVMEVGVRDRFAKQHRFEIRDDEAIVDGRWHHAVIVIDRENQTLRGYLDGVELMDAAALPGNGAPIIAAMTDAGYSAGGSPLLVGDHTREPTGQSAWDSLRVYHEALSASDVRALFREYRPVNP